MYNERIKREFIEENKSSGQSFIKAATMDFESVESTEEAKGKDFSCFSVAEILAYYKTFSSSSLESLKNKHCRFIRYADFCLNRNLISDKQNHFSEINDSVLLTCVNKGNADRKIITRKELLDNLKELPNPGDQFLALALFEGLGGREYEDFVDLKLNAFSNGDPCMVKLNSGRTFSVSPQLKEFAKQATEEYLYYPYMEDVTFGDPIYYPLDDNNILKSLPNTTSNTVRAKKMRARTRLLRIQEYFGLPCFTYKALQESGRIHMIKELMEKEDAKDIRIVINKYSDEIELRYGAKHASATKRYIEKYGQYFQ